MATIRKRGLKWQVQVRRKGSFAISHSFHNYKDAEEWARYMEVQADRKDLPANIAVLKRLRLKALVERYRDTISVHKRRYSPPSESRLSGRTERHWTGPLNAAQ
jgi:hypothetical protein